MDYISKKNFLLFSALISILFLFSPACFSQANDVGTNKTSLVLAGFTTILVITFAFVFILITQHLTNKKQILDLEKSYMGIISKIEENTAKRTKETEPKPVKPAETMKREPLPAAPQASQREEKIKTIEIIESEISEISGNETGKKLISSFLADEDIDVKIRAIRALYRYDAYGATRELDIILKTPAPEIRIKAINILGSWTPSSALKILINITKSEKETQVIKEVLHLMFEFIRDKNRFIPDDLQKEGMEIIKTLQKKDRWIVE